MPEVTTSTTLRLACSNHEEAVQALAQVVTLGMRRSALRKTCEKAQVCAHDVEIAVALHAGGDNLCRGNSALGLP